jgi:copper resistance protein B
VRRALSVLWLSAVLASRLALAAGQIGDATALQADPLLAAPLPPHQSQEPPAATVSEREHVAPEPPARELHDMPHGQMTEIMAMNDAAPLGMLLADQLEGGYGNGMGSFGWYAQGWYGGDYNKAWLRTEGEQLDGATANARAELLWDRVFSRWWSVQCGWRHDFDPGGARDWLAAGVQGLAPYFFKIEATAYVGDAGRTAARVRAEYDLLFTQRLILQPELELNAYGKDNPQAEIAAGLSDLQLALRLRYEVRREFAPYVGIVWLTRLGGTADLARSQGKEVSVLQAVAGVRLWL